MQLLGSFEAAPMAACRIFKAEGEYPAMGKSLSSLLVIFMLLALFPVLAPADDALTLIGVNSRGYEEYKNSKDGMILIKIPAGEFWMGSPDNEGFKNEHPRHKVLLDSYYIGKYEVTNQQFSDFTAQTRYRAYHDRWKAHFNSSTANYPVVCLSWNNAKAYCDWAGLSLPTEAQWEKAARGPESRTYPWGDTLDNNACNWDKAQKLPGMLDFMQGRGIVAVGSFPKDMSPYGVMDMGGNVWEWCADNYDDNYYLSSPASNPGGAEADNFKVARGGSWFDVLPDMLRAADRRGNKNFYDATLSGGFRCVYYPKK